MMRMKIDDFDEEWYYDMYKVFTCAELQAEVIASKTAQTEAKETDKIQLGFLEIFPELNSFKLRIN